MGLSFDDSGIKWDDDRDKGMEMLRSLLEDEGLTPTVDEEPELPPDPIWYESSTGIYHVGQECHGEGAIIWTDIPRFNSFSVDCNVRHPGLIVMLDTAMLDRHFPRLRLEWDYRAAFMLARSKRSPGTVIICRDGQFYVPCTGFYNPAANQMEYLVNVFNVRIPRNVRNIWGSLAVKVGNISGALNFEYATGTEIDWPAAVEYLLNFANGYFGVEPLQLFDVWDGLIKDERPYRTMGYEP